MVLFPVSRHFFSEEKEINKISFVNEGICFVKILELRRRQTRRGGGRQTRRGGEEASYFN
jgi:hypothetical protein